MVETGSGPFPCLDVAVAVVVVAAWLAGQPSAGAGPRPWAVPSVAAVGLPPSGRACPSSL